MCRLTVVSVLGSIFFFALSGCEKVPTWTEITKQDTPRETPAATAPKPSATTIAEPNVVAPVIPEPPKVDPKVLAREKAEATISGFKSKSERPDTIGDVDINGLTLLTECLEFITEINANGSEVSNKAFPNIDKLTFLRELRLVRTRVLDAACSNIAKVHSLEVLSLAETGVSAVGIAALSDLPNLKELDLSKTRPRVAGFKAIGDFPALEVLKLNETEVTNQAMELICNARTIKRLHISNAFIDDYGLAPLRNLPDLEYLEMNGVKITGEGLGIVLKGGGLSRMVGLHMYKALLSVPGARAISSMKNLESLNIGGIPQLSDQDVFVIISGMKKLKYLNVANCGGLNGQGLKPLMQCKDLEELVIGGNAISAKAYETIRAALPGVKVQ